MKKPGKGTIILFVLVLLATLLATAPATLLSVVAEKASKGQVLLANASGTVWQGSAVPALRQRNGNLLPLEKLHWDMTVWQLLTGKLVLQLRWDNVQQPQPMLLTASFSQVELRNAVLPLYAGLLGEAVPLLKPIQLSGQVIIRSPQFTLTRQGMSGQAVAEWSNAGSVLSAVKPLGHYQINLEAAGTRMDIALKTVTGALLLEGRGQLAPGQGFSFRGSARAAPNSAGGLEELLGNFGPQSEPGVHVFNVMQ